MTLSDKMGNIGNAEYLFIEGEEPTNDYDEVILAKDVKEFIKRIKDEIFNMKALGCISRRNEVTIKTIINEKAGDKLIWN